MPQACRPQCRKVWPSARSARAGSSSPAAFGGAPFSLKKVSGSAAPQNTRPMPMPAAKSIANQEKTLYSGSSSSLPRRMLPIRLAAITMPNTTKAVTIRT